MKSLKTITEVDVSGINDNLKQYLSDKTSSLKSELENYNSESDLLNLDKILNLLVKKRLFCYIWKFEE